MTQRYPLAPAKDNRKTTMLCYYLRSKTLTFPFCFYTHTIGAPTVAHRDYHTHFQKSIKYLVGGLYCNMRYWFATSQNWTSALRKPKFSFLLCEETKTILKKQ